MPNPEKSKDKHSLLAVDRELLLFWVKDEDGFGVHSRGSSLGSKLSEEIELFRLEFESALEEENCVSNSSKGSQSTVLLPVLRLSWTSCTLEPIGIILCVMSGELLVMYD